MNLFLEVKIIKDLISEYEYNIENLVKYYHDIIQTSFTTQVEYKNGDICLDYIDYSEYVKLNTKTLKQILESIAKEIDTYEKKIKMLKVILANKLKKIEELSLLTLEELTLLNLPKVENTPIFIADDATMHINPLFNDSLSLDMILSLIEYISTKEEDKKVR